VNLDELRPILHAYRAQVQQAWSPETAHEGFEGKPGDPAGQCGVTSAWLQRRLREDHGIEALYCVGTVYIGFPWRVASPHHCWLEIDPGRVVIDLTAGQVEFASAAQLLYARYRELIQGGIDYHPHCRWSAASVLADPVQARLALLQEALS